MHRYFAFLGFADQLAKQDSITATDGLWLSNRRVADCAAGKSSRGVFVCYVCGADVAGKGALSHQLLEAGGVRQVAEVGGALTFMWLLPPHQRIPRDKYCERGGALLPPLLLRLPCAVFGKSDVGDNAEVISAYSSFISGWLAVGRRLVG
jgi:hypothetical protein